MSNEVFFGVIIVCVLGVCLRIYLSRIPKTSQSAINQFKASIPKEFHNYVYYLDDTGVAFDLENDKLLLLQDGLGKAYPRSEIRGVTSNVEGANQWKAAGGVSVTEAYHMAMDNRKERQKAYKQSGIFVEVADIDHPVWQIKFSDGDMMRRYWEIFRQYLEGTLKPQSPSQSGQ